MGCGNPVPKTQRLRRAVPASPAEADFSTGPSASMRGASIAAPAVAPPSVFQRPCGVGPAGAVQSGTVQVPPPPCFWKQLCNEGCGLDYFMPQGQPETAIRTSVASRVEMRKGLWPKSACQMLFALLRLGDRRYLAASHVPQRLLRRDTPLKLAEAG